jgi:hypothetical protein
MELPHNPPWLLAKLILNTLIQKISTANALVDIHDTFPTSDQWNYAAVEIVAVHQ